MKKLFIFIFISFLFATVFAQSNIKHITKNAEGKETVSLKKQVLAETEMSYFYKNRSILWTEPENISNNENEDSRDMGIAMGPDSTLHMVYCDDVPGFPGISRQRISYRNKPYGGEWSEAQIIDDFSGVAPRNNHQASINVSDNGDVHVVFHYWAYDGTGRNQIGYTKYTNETQTWSTQLISGNTGTVFATYSNYPRVTSTETNIPVVVWGNDNRTGSEEVYLNYFNGTWQIPILVSSPETDKAQFPVVTPIGNEEIFVLFREYNIAGDSLTLYYRIFDASTGNLSDVTKIDESKRQSTSNFDVFDLYDVCYVVSEKVFIADNSRDTILSYYYDINSQLVTRNSEKHISNYNGNPNYNMLSVCSDNAGVIHLAYTVWNMQSNSVRYLSYHETNGYSFSEVISSTQSIDAPQIIFGKDEQLHVLFADDSEDTNNDGYVDREVYYSAAYLGVGIENQNQNESKILAYPNPSSNGIFKLNTTEKFEIIISNINGSIILKTNSNANINLSDYPNGMYILKAKSSKSTFTSLLIKE